MKYLGELHQICRECQKMWITLEKNNSALKSGKSTIYISSDTKYLNLDFDTSLVKICWKLTEIFALKDITLWFDGTR